MATESNKFGIYIGDSRTVTIGHTSTVAEDGVAGLAQRGVLFCNNFIMVNSSDGHFNGNTGTVVAGSAQDESYVTTTGWNGDNKMVEIQNGNIDSGKINLIINQTEANKTIRIQDITVQNVELTGSGVKKLDGAWTSGGDLAISAGTLDTTGSNLALTVSGNVTGAGILIGNMSTINLGSLAMSGTYNASANVTNLNDRDGPGAQLRMNVGDIIHNAGIFNFTGSVGGTSYISLNGASDATNGLYDVTIAASSRTIHISSYALTIARHLTITSGTLSTTTQNLTVIGELKNLGTFVGNSSTVILKDLVIEGGTFNAPDGSGMLTLTGEGSAGYGDGYAFRRVAGAYVHSSGTMKFTGDRADPSEVRMGTSGQHFNNVIVNSASGSSGDTGASRLVLTINDEGFYLDGYLTLTKGKMDMVGNRPVTVTGDVSIANGCVLGEIGTPWTNDDISLGSLTIASGGTYSAPSTTIIKSEVGTKCWDNQSGGNFIHNNGLVRFDSTIGDTTFDNAGADPFYDLEAKTNGDCKYLNAVTVENDLTMNHSNLSFGSSTDGSGAITVHGTTRLVDGIAFTTSTDNVNADNYGFVVVEGGTFRTSSNASKKVCRGIKQTGGTIT